MDRAPFIFYCVFSGKTRSGNAFAAAFHIARLYASSFFFSNSLTIAGFALPLLCFMT